MTAILTVPQSVLERFGLTGAEAAPLGHGLINHTWLMVSSGGRKRVLQRVNGIFPPAVNDDIAAVTQHLARSGLETPMLVPSRDGARWVEDEGIWRVMTHVPGTCRNALENATQAREAGALLGRFHRALAGFEHRFAASRLGVHDTARHLDTLERALTEHTAHRDYGLIAPLGHRILEMAAALPSLPTTPDRIVHGDPKINNIIFAAESDRARCLIDLDTLGPMPLPLELGDAFRSWCNPGSEDTTDTSFSLAAFGAAVEGYASATAGFIEPEESAAMVPATLTILVELAARFCADALNESYFGWDAARFPSRSAHNRIRAEGQLREFASLLEQRTAAEGLVNQAFAATR